MSRDARHIEEWGKMAPIPVGERQVAVSLEVKGPTPDATDLFLELSDAIDAVVEDGD